ncbi:MAG: acyl-CoA dehydrogenase family protein, partial [Mycobacterium sp.]|nr:acyl-CoA dehydrogenase family protein [Mycobacterium sp.]
MDFSHPDEAEDLGGLVRTITEAVCTPDHPRELDGAADRFDRALWPKLVEADVLSAAAPESLGGGGYGV